MTHFALLLKFGNSEKDKNWFDRLLVAFLENLNFNPFYKLNLKTLKPRHITLLFFSLQGGPM